MNRVLKPAARRAGVPWAGFHTFRHTCATTLFRRGLNAKQVQVWLGHHSPAFTLATYVHYLADDLPDASFPPKPRLGPLGARTANLACLQPKTSPRFGRSEASGLLLIRGSQVRILPRASRCP